MGSQVNPALLLAATSGPGYVPQATTDEQIANAQRASQAVDIGAQQLQGLKYQNQESAMQLSEQQQLMQATQAAIARRASIANPAAPPQPGQAMPAPAAPFMRTPEGLIIRDPNAGAVAGPNDQVTPGVVGVSPSGGPPPTASTPPAAATPPPPENRSVYQEALDNLQGKVRPSTLMGWQTQQLAMQGKMADMQKTVADATEASQKVQIAKNDSLAALMQTVKDGGYTHQAVSGAIGYMASHGFSDEAQQLAKAVNANPDNIQGIVDPILSQASAARVASQARQVTAETGATKQAIEQPGQEADAAQKQRVNLVQQLRAAPDEQTYNQIVAGVDDKTQRALLPDFSDAQRAGKLLDYALTPEQAVTAQQKQATLDETSKRDLTAASQRNVSNAIAAGHLQQTQLVNGMKYGPGTQEYWVKQLAQNPDSVKLLPPELHGSVGKAFMESTGLPLPTAISSTTQTQETAARNALDNVTFVQNALRNPEIANNIGPIMGRLGNVEQSFGSAPNLSPQAAAMAQELRTRMRYLVFQEGKQVLGGRMPQELMKQLEASSPNVKMNANLLTGALSGVKESALSVMDNADRQRFGGQMRPREMRGLPAATSAAAPLKKTPWD